MIPKVTKFEDNYENVQNQAIRVLETRKMMNYVIVINQKPSIIIFGIYIYINRMIH